MIQVGISRSQTWGSFSESLAIPAGPTRASIFQFDKPVAASYCPKRRCPKKKNVDLLIYSVDYTACISIPMGRRNRGKDNKKALASLSPADKLKEARHEFQTIPQTFPIARQLLLEEIKRLESELASVVATSSQVATNQNNARPPHESLARTSSVPESTTEEENRNEDEDEIACEGSIKANLDIIAAQSAVKTDSSLQEQDILSLPLLLQTRSETSDRWDPYHHSAKDESLGCDELKCFQTNYCQDATEFSPRGFENERTSLKIFIPYHEYPGVSTARRAPFYILLPPSFLKSGL